MAITITKSPSSLHSAYRPIITEVTSDRLAATEVAITGVTSGTGAKARYAKTSQPYKVGDIVVGTLFSETTYNVRQTVTVISTNYFETNVDYAANSTGTITRSNDDFQVKGDLYVFDQTKQTVTAETESGDTKTITTATSHGYSVGDFVRLFGGPFDGVYKITTIVDVTRFQFTTTELSAGGTGTVRKGTLVGSKRQKPITVGGVDLFRFSTDGFIRTKLSYNLTDLGTTVIATPNESSIIDHAIYFTEEWNDIDNLLQSFETKLGSVSKAVNATLQHQETQNLTAYTLTASDATKKFLTNMPNNSNIRVGEEAQLSFLAIASQTYTKNIKPYDLDGNALTVITESALAIQDQRGIIPINAILSTYSKVEVYLTTGATVCSETKTFVVDHKCYASPVRFAFLNRLGGMDFYTFTGDYSGEIQNRKTEFTKALDISFAVKDRGNTTLGVSASNSFEVFSSFIDDATGTWLAELITSPTVFIVEGGVFVPVIVLNGKATTKNDAGMFQMKLSCVYANDLIIQGNS